MNSGTCIFMWTTLSKHLMKPMTDVANSSMLSDESRNILNFVLLKQSCSLASASSDHFVIELVTGGRERGLYAFLWVE